MTLNQVINDLFDLYVFSHGVQIVVQEADCTTSPGSMVYCVKFEGDLSSDTCALCALDQVVVAQVNNNQWHASVSVELRGFAFLKNIIGQFADLNHREAADDAIRVILTIDAHSSDHWVEPLVNCKKGFMLDPTICGQLSAYEGEILDDLLLVIDWWKFIKSLFSSTTTKREWHSYRQAAAFVVDNSGTWNDKSLQRLLLLCQTAASLDPLFLQFPTVLTDNQEI